MIHLQPALVSRHASSREGATLTEVLMSLLIMSIGVVSVISLFPISIIRAVQATQLTNAKFAEQNAEQILTSFPGLIYGNVPEWIPGASYNPGDVVLPPIRPGRHDPASPRRFICVQNPGSGMAPPLQAGIVDPEWEHPIDFGGGVYGVPDGPDIIWRVDTAPRVIDPYGAIFMREAGGPDYHLSIGNKIGSIPAGTIQRLNPFAGVPVIDQLSTADAFFALPDSWVLETELLPASIDTSISPAEITFLPGPEVQVSRTNRPRVTLVNSNGTAIASRPLHFGSMEPSDAVRWAGRPGVPLPFVNNPPLPVTLDEIDEISSVRIEQFERRYTWMLTVPAATGLEQSRATCVVFFNRGFSLEDEFLYDANFGNPNADVDEVGGQDEVFSDQVRLWWQPGDPRPNLKTGGFVFDARSGHWYQIRMINRIDESSSSNPRTALLTLSESVYVPTPDASTISAGDQGRAILMRGIIHLFDLEL